MSNTANSPRPKIDGRITHALVQVGYRLGRLDRRRLMAIGIALLAAVITQTSLSRASGIEASLGHRSPVVVANVGLPPGAILTASDVSVELWPVGQIPEGTLQSLDFGSPLVLKSNIYPGEPISSNRLESANLGLADDELAVTISQPLAKPPLEVGYLVKLVGVSGNQENYLASATVLATGRVVSFTDDAVTIAVDSEAMPRIISHSAVGSVELVITPQRG